MRRDGEAGRVVSNGTGVAAMRAAGRVARIARRPVVVVAAAAVAVALPGAAARAANGPDTWVGNTSALWSDGTNWSGTNTPPITGDSLVFGAAGTAGTTLKDDLMTPATFNVAGITFNSGAPAYVINPNTAATNGFTLTGDIANSSTSLETINDLIALSGTRTFTMTAGGGNITLGGAVSGSGGGITTAGAGTLTLSVANSYTGATSIGSGTILSTPVAGGLGASSSTAVSGTLNLTLNQGVNTTATYTGLTTVTGAGTINVTFGSGAASNNASTILNGDYSQFTGTINLNAGATTTAGKAQMNGADNASATVNVLANGTLYVSAAVTKNASLNLNGGTTGEALGQLRLESAANWAGPVTLKASTTIGGNGSTGTISGNISQSGGTFGLTRLGSGTTVLSGSDSFAGPLAVSAGTLVLGTKTGTTVGSLSSAVALTLGSGTGSGIFQVGDASNAVNQTLASIVVSGTGTANRIVGGNAAVSTLSVANTGADTYAGFLGGTGTNQNNLALTKTNTAGVLTLSGTNTYTGGTTINGGGVTITNASALGTGTVNLVNQGANFTTLTVSGGITLNNPIAVDMTTARNGINTTGTGSTSIAGPITISNGGNFIFLIDAGGTALTVSNTISTVGAYTGTLSFRGSAAGGSGLISNKITLAATSTMDVNATVANWKITSTGNTWGFTNIQSTGNLVVGANDAVATGSVLGGSATAAGVLDLNGFNQTLAGLNLTTTTIKIGNGSTTAASQLTVSGSGTYTWGGVIQDTLASGARTVALVKSGTGTQALTAADTYSGGTTISGGTLSTGSTGALGSGNVTVADTTGAVLTLGNAASIGDAATLTFGNASVINLNAAAGTSETLASLVDSTTPATLGTPGSYTASQLNTYFGTSSFASPNGETVTITGTPEPASFGLLGVAAAGLLAPPPPVVRGRYPASPRR